jgi:hypothetical protein
MISENAETSFTTMPAKSLVPLSSQQPTLTSLNLLEFTTISNIVPETISQPKKIETPSIEHTNTLTKSEYYKKWYNENKQQHKAHLLEKIQCECGKKVCRNSMRTHKKSSLHINAMNKINNYHTKEKPEKDDNKKLTSDDAMVIMNEIRKLEGMLLDLKNKN